MCFSTVGLGEAGCVQWAIVKFLLQVIGVG